MTYEEMEELEQKLVNKYIDIYEFLNAIPDVYIPKKADLIEVLKERRNETAIN